jgi:hypothetical protein
VVTGDYLELDGPGGGGGQTQTADQPLVVLDAPLLNQTLNDRPPPPLAIKAARPSGRRPPRHHRC